MKKYEFILKDLDCAACANEIQEKLEKNPNLHNVNVNFAKLKLTYETDGQIIYEEKELLNPCYIDKYSGYRYYDDENIKQMNQILYLKKLGFSLDEIKKYDEKLVKNKIEEYQEKIIQYTSNINILKDIDNTSTKGEEVKKAKKPFEFKGYYKKDYRIIGFWKTIALLKKNQKFKYREQEKNQDFELERITINPIENEVIAYINKKSIIAKYTKDYILDIIEPKSTSCYEYKKVNGKKYLFIEWKDECYYVLEKIGGINFMEEMFENKEKMYHINLSKKDIDEMLKYISMIAQEVKNNDK